LKETINQKEITEQLLRLLKERGKKALELTRKTVIEEKIESKVVLEALKYFITEYWHDTIRPGLFSLVCEAVGGDPDITNPIAISVSLISGGIDIHDDIIDQSEKKVGLSTVFGKFGKDIAMLVGDALLFKGFNVLYAAIEKGIPPKQIAIISDIITKTFFELGDAEALELQFRGRVDVSPEHYISVVRKKAADVEACTRISAIVGGGSKEEIEALAEYGRILGMLLILRDDMVDMFDPEETIHRIKKEHLSLVILYALQNTEMKHSISDLIKKTVTEKDVEKLTAIVEKAGGFALMNTYMNELAKDAYNKIELAKFNKNYLAILINGMLLPNWKSYLVPPSISNR
jgi:geranylgeranyl diphosphate synthase type I